MVLMLALFDEAIGHVAVGFYALTVVTKTLAPAFPHASSMLTAVSEASFQLALLASNPQALAAALGSAGPGKVTLGVKV
jgi:hypothetical protein